MVVSRVTRVSNPRKRRRLNPRKMSLKQKLNFGSKRQRAAAKAALSRKRHNPVKRKRVVAKRRVVRVNARRRRRANPAHLLTLGILNPNPRRRKARNSKRRSTKMAVTKRRRRRASANPRRRRRKNSVKVIVRRRRRRASSNPRRRRRHASANPRRRRRMNSRRRGSGRRRNPQMFGRQMNAFEVTKAIGGGLAGVAITKAVPNMLPASLVSSSPFMASITSIVVAVASGMLVKAILKTDPIIGDAIMFGGLMQAGSVMLNAFLPSVGTVIGLQGLGNGMGDLVAGRFPVPMNPVMAGQSQGQIAAPAVTPAAAHAASAAGVGAIYNPFGRAM